MRVALNTYPMAFHNVGGAERQLMDLRDALPAAGVRAKLFDQWNPRLDETDLVHFFSVIGGSWHFCNFIRTLGLPLVISPNFWLKGGQPERYPLDEIHQQLMLADVIILNSEVEKERLVPLLQLPEEKIRIVKSWISPKFIARADPSLARNVLGMDGPFVLSAGSIVPYKNQLHIVRAIRQFPHLKLLIVGSIRDEAYAELCFREGGDQVRYIGEVPHNAQLLPSLMAACNGFLAVGDDEASTLSVLEAAAQGAPIIVSGDGSMREYLEDCALYVTPGSTQSIVEAIGVILAEKRDFRAMDDMIAKFHSANSAAREIAKIYQSLI